MFLDRKNGTNEAKYYADYKLYRANDYGADANVRCAHVSQPEIFFSGWN